MFDKKAEEAVIEHFDRFQSIFSALASQLCGEGFAFASLARLEPDGSKSAQPDLQYNAIDILAHFGPENDKSKLLS